MLVQAALVRVFGEKTEVLIDRERDNGTISAVWGYPVGKNGDFVLYM